MTSDANTKTLQAYEQCFQKYIEGTPQETSGGARKWIGAALAGLPKDAAIFEIGSAFGRDALYMQALGHAVECSDATSSGVSCLSGKGLNARLFNVLTDEFSKNYDFIFANAVLLHFTREEAQQVIAKVYAALNKSGRFAFSLKQGEGEGWSSEKMGAPRYFCYWTREGIEAALRQSEFKKWTVSPHVTDWGVRWWHITAEK